LSDGEGSTIRYVPIVRWVTGHQLLKPGILFLQVLKLPSLFYSQTAVFSTPAIVSLLSDANLSAGFSDRDTLVDMDFSFSQLIDNLFRSAGSSDRLSPLFVLFLLTL
jgi:hypothetical protein